MSRPRVAKRCTVCDRPVVPIGSRMCGSCGESYDRARRRDDGTIFAAMAWAAARARRFERAKAKIHTSTPTPPVSNRRIR